MSIAVIALSTLVLASQAMAQILDYTSPIATTVWTAGQPATVSWTNSCNEVVGNTTFPIYIQGPPVGMIRDPIGYLDCKKPGKATVMIPATLPKGDEYWIWAMTKDLTSASFLFTILPSTPGSTTTTLPFSVLPTTTLPSSVLPTTTVISTTTNPPNPTGSSPAASNEGDDNKSNGAVIGGSTAAAVVAVIAAVMLLYFRRLRRQQPQQKVINAPQVTSPYNQILPSMENPSKGPEDRGFLRHKSLKQRSIDNIQYKPQDRPSDPQSQIIELQEEKVHSQYGHLRNPQSIPVDAQDQPFTTPRSPQGIHAPIPKDNSQDIHQQIHILQTELNRLQASLDS
ncbi:MAG: hypothetical protein J3R72DRAFT_444501 [Linnemannia gamsii]|nr:MAG: hypothetical protein J3R72DRAFT_444501 [Linnemannia gamsii]